MNSIKRSSPTGIAFPAFCLILFILLPALACKKTSSPATGGKGNLMSKEKSPYLILHASSPIDWLPWGEAAFQRAKKENKLIFLSIGFSTCHWCHVMLRESFADKDIAAYLNKHFISVKVDREERPDIDNHYLAVSRKLIGKTGWPVTVLMTPDKRPFFASVTYIPKETRFGVTGLLETLGWAQKTWTKNPNLLRSSGKKLLASLERETRLTSGAELGKKEILLAYRSMKKRFDFKRGGFGAGKKFAYPQRLFFLLRVHRRTGDRSALRMTEKTLRAMRRGGLIDHLGHGFFRYTTDPFWRRAHYEKLLYDQALPALAYLETYQATGKKEYLKTARQTLDYVLREMTSPKGGFYSALDAESDGEEGKYYFWTDEELEKILGKKLSADFIHVYNIDPLGNLSMYFSGWKTGANVLFREKSMEKLARERKISPKTLRERLARGRERLLQARAKRNRPLLDDKLIVDWNGMMIAAMARGAAITENPAYEKAARAAADFILKKMRAPDGGLMHRYREGEVAIPGHLDDYVFFIWGLLELYETTFETRYLKSALKLNRILTRDFWDRKNGGYFFSAKKNNEFGINRKEIGENRLNIFTANSMAMLNLLRLSRITADHKLEKQAAEISRAFSRLVAREPRRYAQLLTAVDFALGPSFEIVITGKRDAPDTRAMLRALRGVFVPNKVVVFRPLGEKNPEIAKYAEYVKDQKGLNNKATAYVCLNYNCKFPTNDVRKMLELLKAR